MLCAAFATLIIPVAAQKWRQMSGRNSYKAALPNFIIILTDDQDVVLDGMVIFSFYRNILVLFINQF